MKHRPQVKWRPQLTRQEKRVGWAFFALYLFVFPFLVGGVVRFVDERWELLLTPAQSNALYYGVVAALLVLSFWDFLRNGARIWLEHIEVNLFALSVGVIVALAATCLAGCLPQAVPNPVREDYPAQFLLSPVATVAVVMFLRPAVEEMLYRGLLFGSLRKTSRALAYAVSGGLFALATVWQYVPTYGPAALGLAVCYLPLGLVQCWSYDVAGSVFTPIVLRILTGGVFLIIALSTAH